MKNKNLRILRITMIDYISSILNEFFHSNSYELLDNVKLTIKPIKWALEDEIENSLKEEEKKIKKIRSRNIGPRIRKVFQKQQKVGAQIDENDLSQFVSFDEMEISLSFNELFYLINDACSTNEKTKKHFFPLNVRVWF